MQIVGFRNGDISDADFGAGNKKDLFVGYL